MTARSSWPETSSSTTITWTSLGRAWCAWSIQHIAVCHGRSKQRRALSLLSDEQLDDIGLSREQAMDEARRWFWQA